MPEILTHAGLASALGCLVHAAAAYRGGLSRAQAQPGLEVDLADGSSETLVGHAAWPPSPRFDQLGQWLHLARYAIDDLRANGWRPVDGMAVVLVAPLLDPARFGWTLADPAPTLDAFVLAPLLDFAGLAVPDPWRRVVAGGHAGAAEGVLMARDLLAEGARAVLVLAVDSYLDVTSPGWLEEEGRLKTGDGGAVIPGEAAVAVVLAREGDGARVLAAAHEPRPMSEDGDWPAETATVRGRRWKAVFDRCRAEAGTALARCDAYVDLNGEAWRSAAWGDLVARTADRWQAAKLWTPVESFGETGAASGALGMALASRAWARGYAKADSAAIWSLAESGATGLVIMGR